MSTGKPEQVEEERRLLYVAMTRAKDELHLVHPLRMFVHNQRRWGDSHLYTPRTRFIPSELLDRFDTVSRGREGPTVDGPAADPVSAVDVAAKLRNMW
jgi:DNA helicase-2/ATP-dependent DNA helicase PcrA